MIREYKKSLDLNKKKIFVLSKRIDAGIETFIKNLVDINFDRYKLILYSYERSSKTTSLSNNINYINSSLPGDLNPSIKKLVAFLKDLINTNKIFRNKCKKIVLCNDIYSLIVASLNKILFNNQLLIIFRVGGDIGLSISRKPFFLYRDLIYQLTKMSLFNVEYIIFTSKLMKKDFFSYFKSVKKIHTIIIYQGINLKKSHIAALKKIDEKTESLFIKNKFNIISVGRFDYPKDFQAIVKAFIKANKEIPKSHLWLIGDGKDRVLLEKLMIKHGLNNKITLTGWKSNPYPYLKRSTLFVYSSYSDGFGFVLLEAMSQGLPILATNTPYGPREILDNGKYGLVIPINNSNYLAKKIITLFNKKKFLRKYHYLSLRRIKKYSSKNMNLKYLKVFDQLN